MALLIEVSRIPEEGASFEGEEDAAILELIPSDGVMPAGPVRYRLFAQFLKPQLIVRGDVEVPLRAECSRCGGFFSTLARDPAFLRDYLLREGQRDVDVTPDLREAVLLTLPANPLCDEACAGLCPRCGRNLNEGPCECRPSSDGGRWGALDGLRI
jgi:uncharacterized protein